MSATIGEVSAILGWSDALLDFGSLLPTAQPRGRRNACERGLGEAKHAGKEGIACMLMASGPSSWAVGATETRRWWRADLFFDTELAPRVLDASEEAPVADGNGCSSSPANCHINPHKIPSQHYGSMLREHRLTRECECCSGISRGRRRLNLLEHAGAMRDWAAAEEERQLHSALHRADAGSAPAA